MLDGGDLARVLFISEIESAAGIRCGYAAAAVTAAPTPVQVINAVSD